MLGGGEGTHHFEIWKDKLRFIFKHMLKQNINAPFFHLKNLFFLIQDFRFHFSGASVFILQNFASFTIYEHIPKLL